MSANGKARPLMESEIKAAQDESVSAAMRQKIKC